MIKRSFIGLQKPKLEYEAIGASPPKPQVIKPSKTVTLFAEGRAAENDDLMLKINEKVKTGQKLRVFKSSDEYVVSSVTGTIKSIEPYFGDFGKTFTAINIALDAAEEIDNSFSEQQKLQSMETVVEYLGKVAGLPPVKLFTNPEKPIKIIIINAMPSDLLITTDPYILRCQNEALKDGVAFLKTVKDLERIVIVAPEAVSRDVQVSGIEVMSVESKYPSGNPRFVINSVNGSPVPADKEPEDVGIALLKAETVAAIGTAFKNDSIPADKIIDVIKKDGTRVMVSTKIGTPIVDIFSALGVTTNDKDRIVIGGPMTGSAIFSEDFPILPDTDAIIIQDSEDVVPISDYACINCGECIRICPANVPVNMLIRLLEAGEYDDAADNYDLNSCIDCGLCSFVCTARIPIFQYIRLAKHELARLNAAEADNNG